MCKAHSKVTHIKQQKYFHQLKRPGYYTEFLLCPRPVGEAGALSVDRRPSSVCLSDVAYIGSNSKTKRPRKTKLCTGVSQITSDSHTDFKVKSLGGAGAYCGGDLAAQLVIYTTHIYFKAHNISTQQCK